MKTHFVPFEPGIGSDRVMTPKRLVIRVVKEVPPVDAVKDRSCCPAWFDQPEVEDLLYLRTRERGKPRTRVAVMRDQRWLFVAFECMEPRMSQAHRMVPRDADKGQLEVFPGVMPRLLYYDECVGLTLDHRHDKTTFSRMLLNINGARRATRLSTAMGWTVFPSVNWLEHDDLSWESDVAETDDRWHAAIRVDLQKLGIDPANHAAVGLNLERMRNVECWQHYAWSPVVHLEHAPALALGDAYLSGDPVQVTKLDWGELEAGPNRLRLTLAGNEQDSTVYVRVGITDKAGERGEDYRAETRSEERRVPSRDTAELGVDYHVPFDHAMLKAGVELCDATTGRVYYNAAFPLRSHGDLRIGQPYARAHALKEVKAPDPADADFHEKKVLQVLSKLPKFKRMTTAQGAPSDFVLASVDEKVTFDLMKPGALKRIGDWLCTLFEEDNDRIAALALFTNDDWVTVHAGPRTPMQYHLTPLSMLRLGGGHCYSRAVIGAGIACEMPDPATGRNHEAWPTLVLGHVITAIRRGDDYVFVDPSFGHFFYNGDNTDLATARELEADPELVRRVVKGRRRLVNYARCEAQVRLDLGTVTWPAGAPPE